MCQLFSAKNLRSGSANAGKGRENGGSVTEPPSASGYLPSSSSVSARICAAYFFLRDFTIAA